MKTYIVKLTDEEAKKVARLINYNKNDDDLVKDFIRIILGNY